MANAYNNKIVLSDGTTLIDLTKDTLRADVLLQGYTGHDASGAQVVGTLTAAGETSYLDQTIESDIGFTMDDGENPGWILVGSVPSEDYYYADAVLLAMVWVENEHGEYVGSCVAARHPDVGGIAQYVEAVQDEGAGPVATFGSGEWGEYFYLVETADADGNSIYNLYWKIDPNQLVLGGRCVGSLFALPPS